jgi:Flp pilus assembly protein TadG
MLSPLIRRAGRDAQLREKERGFTMAFVALTMAVLISMAALSIDVATLYQSKAEAQRAADAAALTAARVISISGITTDPANVSNSWQPACGGAGSTATLAAISMAQAQQNLIGGTAASTVQVNYVNGRSGGAGNADCSTFAGGDFGVNPIVTVSVKRTNLPVFFAHIFSLFGSTFASASVSATATAEAYNAEGAIPEVPVNPRCVKPWFIPNLDPVLGSGFVSPATGQITHAGVSPAGVIGETFSLFPDCGGSGGHRRPRACTVTENPVANGAGGTNSLDYLPGQVSNASVAIAANAAIGGCSEATFNDYAKAVAGCDQTTVYACGNALANTVDLTEDPGPGRNDSSNSAQCLINAAASRLDNGQDYLGTVAGTNPGPPPYAYPFQIFAGSNSALAKAGLSSGSQITNSPSIVSLPIYDNGATTFNTGSAGQIFVTVLGFLQVFVNSADNSTGTPTSGNINVTVLNVAGCGNAATNPPVFGTSPVPVRLITPP